MATEAVEAPPKPRLRIRYDEQVKAQLKDQLELSNPMEVPRLTKIVVNCGVGKATQQASLLEGGSPTCGSSPARSRW